MARRVIFVAFDLDADAGEDRQRVTAVGGHGHLRDRLGEDVAGAAGRPGAEGSVG